MRHRLFLHLVLCATLPCCEAACRRAHPQTGKDGWQSQIVESIEDSGRGLAGDYIVQSLANDYAANSVQAEPHWAFSFHEDGSFRRAREGHGATQIEEGSY